MWFALAAFVLVLAAGVFVAFHIYLLHAERAALPQVEGTIRVPGLSSSVSVVRDSRGIPHIRATNLEDLVFAQGYVTAQDRLWQTDMVRRVAAGELSEILGKDYIDYDKRERYLQGRWVAEHAAAELDADTRRIFDAYTRGVNAAMQDAMPHLPLEFKMLRYQPRAWTVADSMLVAFNMAEMLNTSYPSELSREAVQAKLPPEAAADLFPASSWRDHIPGSEAAEIKDDNPPPPMPDEESKFDPQGWLRRTGAVAIPCGECLPGSNDWAVSGAHSVTGKPLLSNDMHLQHSVPGIWYAAHLVNTGERPMDVIGVTLPGLPAVIVGHNQRVAWGFTNVGPDVQDLYIEKLDGRGNYLTGGGWKPLEKRHEVIHVARAADVTVDVDVTRHGPIITPTLKHEARALALRWTIYDPGTLVFPFMEIDRAQDWPQFTAAFSKFTQPGQNVVYADVDGHIGYHATGRIPIRAAGDGTVPVRGDDDLHEWVGYIPYDKLPQTFDPPSGIIATANARITPDRYAYSISKEWDPGYRVQRIYQLLATKPKLSADDMLATQTDTYSALERFFADRFTYAMDHWPKADGRDRAAAELLRAWDGHMSTDSAAARIEANARRRLTEKLLRAKLGDDWKLYRFQAQSLAFENIVNLRLARWLPSGYATWDDLLAEVLHETVQDGGVPGDLRSWKYGEQSRLRLENPVIGAVPWMKRYAGPGDVPQSGSGTTIKQVGVDFGPSERFTADVSDWDHSRLNVVMGESGNFLSAHFEDQWDAWYNGTTFPLPYTQSAVDQDARERLTLEPRR